MQAMLTDYSYILVSVNMYHLMAWWSEIMAEDYTSHKLDVQPSKPSMQKFAHPGLQ